MAAIDTRTKVKVETDCKQILAAIKRRNGIKTESQAINLAIRIAGTQIHLADVNETNELLHQVLETSKESLTETKRISENTKQYTNILLRTFAYLRRMVVEFDKKNRTSWGHAAENDYKAHIAAKTTKDNANE